MTYFRVKRMKDTLNRLIKDIWSKEVKSSLKGNQVYLNVGQGFNNCISILNWPKWLGRVEATK